MIEKPIDLDPLPLARRAPQRAGSTATPLTIKSLVWFFGLTFVITWTCFIAAGMVTSPANPPASGVRNLLLVLGTIAPAIVALPLTAWVGGRAAVAALLGRLVDWRVGARWYLFAVTYTAAIKLAAAVVHRAITGDWPRFGGDAWYLMLASTIASTLLLGQAGEELGWRGYALPRLAARIGMARASILLGIIWAVWHLPLFFMPGIDKTGQSFPLHLLQVTALSVAMAWLYAHTNGSLLLAMLMHAAINNTKDIVPSAAEAATSPFGMSASLVAWLSLALLWLCAGYFLITMPDRTEPAGDERIGSSG